MGEGRLGGEPLRTCVGCRAVEPQRALRRVAGAPGRGAYVHERPSCAQGALHGGLARSLRRMITDSEREILSELAAGQDRAKAVEPPARNLSEE